MRSLTGLQYEVRGVNWRHLSQKMVMFLWVKPTFHSYPFLSMKIVPLWFSLIWGMFLELMLKASSKAFIWTCMRRCALGVW